MSTNIKQIFKDNLMLVDKEQLADLVADLMIVNFVPLAPVDKINELRNTVCMQQQINPAILQTARQNTIECDKKQKAVSQVVNDKEGEKIKSLLISILNTLTESTAEVETENTDCGVMYFPVLRYAPTFEFSDEDIRLIKELGEKEQEDFSTLTDKILRRVEVVEDRHCSFCKYYSCPHSRFMYCSKLQHRIKASRKNGCKYFEHF